MTVEKRCSLLCALVNFRFREFLCRHPNYFCDWYRHERLDPVETLDRALAAPAIEQRSPRLRRHHVSKRIANLIGIENAGGVAVCVEKNEHARSIKIKILGQPVKRAGMIVLDVNRQHARCGACGSSGNE